MKLKKPMPGINVALAYEPALASTSSIFGGGGGFDISACTRNHSYGYPLAPEFHIPWETPTELNTI